VIRFPSGTVLFILVVCVQLCMLTGPCAARQWHCVVYTCSLCAVVHVDRALRSSSATAYRDGEFRNENFATLYVCLFVCLCVSMFVVCVLFLIILAVE